MEYIKLRGECEFTERGCRLARCSSDKKGVWKNGECKCKLKEEHCDRLECPLAREPKWKDGECQCMKIKNFRPKRPGMCGKDKLWSVRY